MDHIMVILKAAYDMTFFNRWL